MIKQRAAGGTRIPEEAERINVPTVRASTGVFYEVVREISAARK